MASVRECARNLGHGLMVVEMKTVVVEEMKMVEMVPVTVVAVRVASDGPTHFDDGGGAEAGVLDEGVDDGGQQQ